MTQRRLSTAIIVSAWLTTTHVSAQPLRTDQLEEEKAAKATAVQPEAREPGDVLVGRLEALFMPAPPALQLSFGGFRPGAGLGPGIGYSTPIGEQALWSARAAWSTNDFMLAESALEIPGLMRDHLHLRTYARWEDAPRLDFFGLGNSAPANEASYGLRSSSAGADAAFHVTGWLIVGASGEYLHVGSGDGSGPPPAAGTLFDAASTPGLDTTTTWWHTAARIAIDRRTSPGYTQHGGLYQVTFHDYADRDDRYSFHRTEVDLRQFVPLFNHNWIVALQGRVDLTDPSSSQATPFFLLPYIGGGSTLRGFPEYRFTDRNSLLLRGELRWTPVSVVDMAVFVDQGEVAPRVDDFALRNLKRGWGIGARFHGSTFTALRLEIARGDEGWRYHIAQGVSF